MQAVGTAVLTRVATVEVLNNQILLRRQVVKGLTVFSEMALQAASTWAVTSGGAG